MNTETTIDTMKAAAIDGAKIAASRAVNQKLCDVVRKQFGDQYPEFFKTPLGRSMESFLIPSLVHLAAENIPGFPAAENVQAVASLAMIAGAEDATGVLLASFLPVAEELANLNVLPGGKSTKVAAG